MRHKLQMFCINKAFPYFHFLAHCVKYWKIQFFSWLVLSRIKKESTNLSLKSAAQQKPEFSHILRSDSCSDYLIFSAQHFWKLKTRNFAGFRIFCKEEKDKILQNRANFFLSKKNCHLKTLIDVSDPYPFL